LSLLTTICVIAIDRTYLVKCEDVLGAQINFLLLISRTDDFIDRDQLPKRLIENDGDSFID